MTQLESLKYWLLLAEMYKNIYTHMIIWNNKIINIVTTDNTDLLSKGKILPSTIEIILIVYINVYVIIFQKKIIKIK